MYEALNVLGAVPWQINTAVLSVVEALYEDQTGYKHLKIPAKESADLPLPLQPPHAFRTTRTKGGGLSAGVRIMAACTVDTDGFCFTDLCGRDAWLWSA